MGKCNRWTMLEQLLEKTFTMSDPRTTPVLEGKAQMHGPLDDTDSDTDFISLEVCGNCRNHLDVAHMQYCGLCGDGYHSVCLERPQNAGADNVICYKCQGQPLSKDTKEKTHSEQAQGEKVLRLSKETQRTQENERLNVPKESTKGTDVSRNAHDSRSILFDGGPKSPITQRARTTGVRRKITVDFDNTSSPEQSVAMDVESPQNPGVNEETMEVGGSSESKPAIVEVFTSPAEGKVSNNISKIHEQGNGLEVLEACGIGYQKGLEKRVDGNLGNDKRLPRALPTFIDKPTVSDRVREQTYQMNLLDEEGPDNRCINSVHNNTTVLPSLLEASNLKDAIAETRQDLAIPDARSPKLGSIEKIGRSLPVEVGLVHGKVLAEQVIGPAHDVGHVPDHEVGLVHDETLMAARFCLPSLDVVASLDANAKGVDKKARPSPSVKDERKVFPITSDMLHSSCFEVSELQMDSSATASGYEDPKENSSRKSSLSEGAEAERPNLGLEASTSAPVARRGSIVDDVRPCELCGDIGYEDMLAVCNDCNAALHVYCTESLLSSVPEGYWHCDICKLNQKVDKPKLSETRPPPPSSAVLRLPSFNNITRKQSNGGNTRSRLSALLQKKRLGSDKRRALKGGPLSQPPAKRFATDVLADAPRLKKQAIENTGPLAIHTPPKILTRDGSIKLTDTGKVKFVPPKSVTGMSMVGEGMSFSGGTGKLSLSAGISPSNPLRANSAQVLSTKKGQLSSSSNNAYKVGGHAQPSDQVGSTASLTAPIGLKNSGSFKYGDIVSPFLVPSKSSTASKLLSNRFGKEGVADAGTQVSPKDGSLSANAQMATVRIATKTSSPKLLKAGRANIIERKSRSGDCMGPLTLSGLKTEHEGHLMKGVDIKDDIAQSELVQKNLFPDANILHPTMSSIGGSNLVKNLKFETSSSLLSKDTAGKVGPGADKVDAGKTLKVESSGAVLAKDMPAKVEPGPGKVDAGNSNAEIAKYSQYYNGQEEKRAMLQPKSSKSTSVKVPESAKADASAIIPASIDENRSVMAASFSVVSAPIAEESYGIHKEAQRVLQGVSTPEIPILDVLDSNKCVLSVDRSTKNDENGGNPTPKSRLPLVWTTSNFVPSLGSTRCYRCKEVGHAAKSCINKANTACISPDGASAFKSAASFFDSGASAKLKVTTTEMTNVGKPSEMGKEATSKTTKVLPKRVDAICTMSPLSPTCSSVSITTQSGVLAAKEHQEAVLVVPPIARAANVPAGEISATTNLQMSPRHQESAKVCPERQIVWKGSFNVSGEGSSNCYHGLQGNLSNRALIKVREVAIKLESSLPLDELPRSSEHNTWPIAFQKSPPINDNIALYFFASNKESHTQYYLPLVDRLIKHNLALKGHIDDAELLIFPSNLLPPGSQCWNNSAFLWAVFRDRKPTSKQAVQINPTSAANQPKVLSVPKPLQPVNNSSLKLKEYMQDTIKSQKSDVFEPSKVEGSRLLFLSEPIKDATPNGLMTLTTLEAKHHTTFQSCLPASDAVKQAEASFPVSDSLLEVKPQQSGKPPVADLGGPQVLYKPIQQPIPFSKAAEEGNTLQEHVMADTVKPVNTSMLQSSSDKSKHLPSYRPSPLTVITSSGLPERHVEALVPGKLPGSSSRSPTEFQDRERGTRDRIHEKSSDVDRVDLERRPYKERDREREWPRDWTRRQDREREWVQKSRPWDWQRGRERDRWESDRERDRERERERERERGQARDRMGERKRGRDRENERDWRGRDWDRERQRERGRERVKERDLERDVSFGRDCGRFRHREHADTEVDREGRYSHQNPLSGSPFTGPKDLSHSWSRLDHHHRSYRHHSRSCSDSLESARGSDELQPQRAESRDRSQDSSAHQREKLAIEESTTNRDLMKVNNVEDQAIASQKECNTDTLCGEKTAGSKDRLKAIVDLNMVPVEIDGNEDNTSQPEMPFKGLSRSVREQSELSNSTIKKFEHLGPLTLPHFDNQIQRRASSPLRKAADLAHPSHKSLPEPSVLCLGFSLPSLSLSPSEGGGPGVPDLNLSLGSNTGHLPQQRELALFMPRPETCKPNVIANVSLGSIEPAGLSLTLAIPEREQMPGVDSGKSAADESVSTSLRLFG